MNKKPKNKDDTEDIIFENEDNTSGGQLKKLRERLKKCTEEKQEYMDGWQRTKADFINFKKEQEKVRESTVKYAKEDLITQIIPIVESFEMAFSNKEAWNNVDKNWRVGVEYIHTQLMKMLENNGVLQIGDVGVKFNPNEYDSISVIKTDNKANDENVSEVVQKGYKLNGKVLRPAKVKVFQYKK
jgi:molecular chaperone GrpE